MLVPNSISKPTNALICTGASVPPTSKAHYPHVSPVRPSISSTNRTPHHLNRRKLAQTAQIDGFSTLDIARPQPERTLQNLAALVNYIKFIQHHTDNLIWSLKDRSQGHLLEKKQLLAKIREAEAEMATIRYVGGVESTRLLLEGDNVHVQKEGD